MKIKHLAFLAEDGYGSKSDLYQIPFGKEEIQFPGECKASPGEDHWSKGEKRAEKCLELRRNRLAQRKLREAGVYRERINSDYDCTGRRFTSGVYIIYATNEYALVRIDTTIDC